MLRLQLCATHSTGCAAYTASGALHRWAWPEVVHCTGGHGLKLCSTQVGMAKSCALHRWAWPEVVHCTGGHGLKLCNTQVGMARSCALHRWAWPEVVHCTGGHGLKLYTDCEGPVKDRI